MPKAWTCDTETHLRAILSLEPKLAGRLVPCRHWRDGGTIYLQPQKALTASAAERAAELGLRQISVPPPADSAQADSPWQLFGLSAAPLPEKLGEDPLPILFLCPDHASVADLASRLLELGCDQMRAGVLPDGRVALWAPHPALHVVLTALDQPHTLVCFEQKHGLYLPLRTQHPFLDQMAIPHNQWLVLEKPFIRRWIDTDTLLPLDRQWQLVQAGHTAIQPKPWDMAIPVPLRLVRSSLEPGKECLWKIESEMVPSFLEWVSHTPEEQLCQLEWLSLMDGTRQTLLVRPIIPTSSITLPVFSTAYERVHPLEPVFIPAGTRLSPPLQVDRLRQAAGLSPGMIAWLETDPDHPGKLAKSQTVASAEFRSLESCLEYQLAAAPMALESWQQSITFSDLEELVFEPGPAAAPSKAAVKAAKPTVIPPRTDFSPTKKPEEAKPAETTAPGRRKRKSPGKPAGEDEEKNQESHTSIRASKALEDWLELPGPLHAPERLAGIEDLSRLLEQSQRPRDAADLRFLHWWSHTPLRDPWTSQGLGPILHQEMAAFTRQAGPTAEGVLKNPLALASQGELTGENRVAASRWIALEIACRDSRKPLTAEWASLLEQLEPWMPVRHAWVAWMNWRHSTGDVQALAQAHDRLLRRLAQGLEVGRDSPPVLSGRLLRERGGRSDAGKLLEAMRNGFAERLNLRDNDPTDRMTKALAMALFAAGALRAGESAQSTSLWEQGAASLNREGPLGQVLRAAVDERLAQIRAHMPHDQSPLAFAPGALQALSPTDQYRLNNLRKALEFLEPAQSINPVSHYLAGLTAGTGANPLRERAVQIQNAPAETVLPLLGTALFELETLESGAGGHQPEEMDLWLQLLQAIQERAGQASADIAKRSLRLGNLLTRRLLEGSAQTPRERSLQFCLRLLRGALHAAGPWGLREEVDKWLHAALEPDGGSPGLFALLAQTGQGRLVGSLLQEMVGRLRAWDMETAGFALVDGLERVLGLAGPEDQATLRLILAAQLARRGQAQRSAAMLEQTQTVVRNARENRQPLRGPALEQRMELARALLMFSLETEPSQGVIWIGAATEMLPALVPPTPAAGLAQAAHGKVLKVVETLVLSLNCARDIETQSGWCEEEEAMLRRVILSQTRVALA